jgi:hypothetical protein
MQPSVPGLSAPSSSDSQSASEQIQPLADKIESVRRQQQPTIQEVERRILEALHALDRVPAGGAHPGLALRRKQLREDFGEPVQVTLPVVGHGRVRDNLKINAPISKTPFGKSGSEIRVEFTGSLSGVAGWINGGGSARTDALRGLERHREQLPPALRGLRYLPPKPTIAVQASCSDGSLRLVYERATALEASR